MTRGGAAREPDGAGARRRRDAAFLVVASTALAIWWTARQDSRPASDAIVVLGSAQYNGVPSSIFEARLEHAIALYEDGVAPVIVTVGGKADGDQFTEAEAGRDYLADAGSRRTRCSPSRRAWTPWRACGWSPRPSRSGAGRTAVLVSDPWHAMRAERMAEDAGMEAESSPTRQGPAVQTRATQFRYILRETAAYLLYRATGESVAGAPGIG